MSNKKAVEVVANTLSVCLDSTRQFITEYAYHYGRFNKVVFNFGGAEYFCVGKTPAKNEFPYNFKWEKHKDQFWAEKHDTILWVASGDNDE